MSFLTTVLPPTAVEAPRIAAFGEWNNGNLGDKAILEGVLDFFQGAGWRVDAYGLGSLTPIRGHWQASGQSALVVGGWSTTPSQAATLQTSRRRVHSLRAGAYVFLKGWLRPARQLLRIQRLLRQLRRAQGVLVGGGALLMDEHPHFRHEHLHFPHSLAAVGWAARKLHLPIFCLGCSAEGEWSPRGERMIAQFVRSCTVIATRDAATARRMTTIWGQPVPIFGDFALIPAGPFKSRLQQRQALRLAVNVMHVPRRYRADQERYEDVLVDTVATWMRRHGFAGAAQVQLFTTGTPEDIAPASRVLARLSLPADCLYIPSALSDLRSFLQSSTAVVASRLHAAILAMTEGTPIVGLAVGSKIPEFLRTLGLHRYSVPVRDERAACRILDLIDSGEVEKQSELLDTAEIDASRAAIRSLLLRGKSGNA